MPFLAAAPIIAAGVGGLMSLIGGAKQNKTTTTTPTLSPEMQALQKRLLGYSTDMMSGQGPQVLSGTNKINQGYAQMPGKVTSQLAGRGFGSSGKLGTALFDTEAARLDAGSNFRGQMAGQGASLGEQLLSSGRGSTTTGPGGGIGDALMSGGNGLSNLSTLLMLSKVLKGGGGGSGLDMSMPEGISAGVPGGIDSIPYYGR